MSKLVADSHVDRKLIACIPRCAHSATGCTKQSMFATKKTRLAAVFTATSHVTDTYLLRRPTPIHLHSNTTILSTHATYCTTFMSITYMHWCTMHTLPHDAHTLLHTHIATRDAHCCKRHTQTHCCKTHRHTAAKHTHTQCCTTDTLLHNRWQVDGTWMTDGKQLYGSSGNIAQFAAKSAECTSCIQVCRTCNTCIHTSCNSQRGIMTEHSQD